MTKVLVPFDGSTSAMNALRFVMQMSPAARPSDLHLLNVQPWPILEGGFLTDEVVRVAREGQFELGRRAIASAEQALLDGLIPFRSHILLGLVPETIVAQAVELGCDQIVMGSRGLGSIKGLLLGSVTTKVLHLTRLPVTLIK